MSKNFGSANSVLHRICTGFFAGCVDSIRGSSNLFEHFEEIVNFENLLNNKVEGQYRKKNLP